MGILYLRTASEKSAGRTLKFAEGIQRSETKNLSNVKKVVDMGEWYKIYFYFPYKSNLFICQKDLLVKGTIEEFEELFSDKIIRKKFNNKKNFANQRGGSGSGGGGGFIMPLGPPQITRPAANGLIHAARLARSLQQSPAPRLFSKSLSGQKRPDILK